MSINNLISLIGIIFDIVGAWFLASGLIKKPIEEIRRESIMSFFNYSYALGYIKQKTESIIGFCFLLGGFLLQGFSYIDTQITNWNIFYIVLFGTSLVACGICIFGFMNYRGKVKEFILKVIAAESQGNEKEIPIDIYQILKYLQILSREYKQKDPIEEFSSKYPNYKTLDQEEKIVADEEWRSLHRLLWEELKRELEYK